MNAVLERSMDGFQELSVVSVKWVVVPKFINVFFNFGSLGVKRDFDITNDWDLHIFGAIKNGVTLIFARAFRETSEFLSVFLVSRVDSGLTTFSFDDFIESYISSEKL